MQCAHCGKKFGRGSKLKEKQPRQWATWIAPFRRHSLYSCHACLPLLQDFLDLSQEPYQITTSWVFYEEEKLNGLGT